MLIFKHSDWLQILSIQSECLKFVKSKIYAKIFIGTAPSDVEPSSLFSDLLASDYTRLHSPCRRFTLTLRRSFSVQFQTNLFVDWNGDSSNYTCFTPSDPFLPSKVKTELFCDNSIPSGYYPRK